MMFIDTEQNIKGIIVGMVLMAIGAASVLLNDVKRCSVWPLLPYGKWNMFATSSADSKQRFVRK